MKCIGRYILLLMAMFSFAFCANIPEKVSVQLQWKHQFEFAGFYAAKEKGFYKEVGLDVDLIEFDGGSNTIDRVLSGDVTFGATYSTLIYRYLKGDPLVLLANFFKQSPLVLVTQKQFKLPSDLKGKKVMVSDTTVNDAKLLMMFKKFDMNESDFIAVPPSFDLQDFIDKKVDAMTVFVTNETYQLDKKGVAYNVLDPSAYGVRFYDLNLFTSQKELREHPQRVAAFRNATIKGWKYALKHKDEIIRLILDKYNTQYKDYASLKYEADQIKNMILPKFYPMGSIDPKRVKEIAHTFISLGILPPSTSLNLDKFIYNTVPDDIGLSAEESNYLNTKNVITYCADPDWLPLSAIVDKRHIGMDADYLSIISGRIGRPFHLVLTKSWNESLRFAREGKCDVLTLAMVTPKRKEYLLFTNPLLNIPLVLVTGIDKGFYTNLMELSDKKIGIVKGYAYIELFRKIYPDIKLTEVESVTKGMRMVAEGKLFGFIDNLTTAGYLVQKEYVGTLKISAKFDENLVLGYGVQKSQPQLRSILDKTIATIDEETKQAIASRWTSIKIENGISHAVLLKILLVVLLVVLIIYYRYRKMSTEKNALEAISMIDSLTELFNRRKIDRLIDSEVKRIRTKGCFSLILIDIDNFKNINDSYGHDVGDIVLKHIAQILKSSVRKKDSAGRWGGEEFLIVCPDTSKEEAAKFAERIRIAIENESFEKILKVTASVGVAEYNRENIGDTSLIRRLDKALYDSKRDGKNRVTVAL
ncbi:diguanylate cyclase [Sulfurovum sp. NBC37-1]|uniref:diguanylate cyclase n=1 Tax=Sulfurovum sp. (strain NBC37-1) TaxID=387093 RepID=UPI0001587569|nr:diguanylate cyclase [Sulfurovum sp. NBC37-1]BAF71816.1 signal transduction response regulator [Sulfurovum sp. NBC37-1]